MRYSRKINSPRKSPGTHQFVTFHQSPKLHRLSTHRSTLTAQHQGCLCKAKTKIDASMSSSSFSEEEDVLQAVMACIDVTVRASDTSGGWTESLFAKKGNLRRGECSWWRDYLSPEPIFPPALFQRRFRVPLKFFRRLLHEIPTGRPELQQKVDAIGCRGATSWRKIFELTSTPW